MIAPNCIEIAGNYGRTYEEAPIGVRSLAIVGKSFRIEES